MPSRPDPYAGLPPPGMSAHLPTFDPAAPSSDAVTPRPGRRVTQRDIARHVGVSHVAVSLALRRNSRISPSLTRKIEDAARQLGYHPDPTLLVLNNYRLTAKARPIRATLAWISPGSLPPEEACESALLWQGARETAERNGYHLDQLGSGLNAGTLQRVLDARGIQGILLVSSLRNGAEAPSPQIDWQRCPAVRLGPAATGPGLHRVSSADMANAILATDTIHERGYRRAGFVSTRHSARQAGFLGGFLQACALRSGGEGDDALPPLLLETGPAPENLRALDAWLGRHRPDAVLTDLPPLRRLLTRLGLSVPRDLALAALGLHDGAAEAGIDQNPHEIGAAACEALIALVKQGARGLPAQPRHLLVAGTWVDGASLPPRPAPPARPPVSRFS